MDLIKLKLYSFYTFLHLVMSWWLSFTWCFAFCISHSFTLQLDDVYYELRFLLLQLHSYANFGKNKCSKVVRVKSRIHLVPAIALTSNQCHLLAWTKNVVTVKNCIYFKSKTLRFVLLIIGNFWEQKYLIGALECELSVKAEGAINYLEKPQPIAHLFFLLTYLSYLPFCNLLPFPFFLQLPLILHW